MTEIDRASELSELRDLWPEIKKHCSAYPAVGISTNISELVLRELDFAALEEKFRKGEAEHGRDWLRMTRVWLERQIDEELLDLVLYHAMIEARFPRPTTPTFETNRDPGDEA